MSNHSVKGGPIGLDLGAHTYKAVQLQDSPDGLVLSGVATVRAPMFGDGHLRLNEMTRAIGRLILTGKFSNRDALVAVSNEDCVARVFQLPKMSSSELEQAVHWEVDKFVPFGQSDYVTDYKIIREVPTEEGTKNETLVVAAKKSGIMAMLDALDQSRLTSRGVDMEAMASARSLSDKKDGAFCVLDIGHTHTGISVFEGPYLRVHRSINVAGSHMMDRIDRALGMGAAEFQQVMAEALSRREVVADALEPLLREVSTEVNRSLDYFRSHDRSDVECIYLIGGGSALAGVKDYLEMNVSADIRQGDPLEHLKVDQSQFGDENVGSLSPRLAVAIGLAKRGLRQE